MLNEIPTLEGLSTESSLFQKWHARTAVAIKNTFVGEAGYLSRFVNINFDPFLIDADYEIWDPGYERGLEQTNILLESMIEEIEEYWDDEEEARHSDSPQRDVQAATKRVFLVHGRDDGTRQTVARVIEQLELEAVILEEQPSQGRTVIEKFEEEATEVGFAVVLLTPDDEGRLRGKEKALLPRARQNVIFELGYFAKFLGRKRVCALRKEDVEIPSDYQGVIYILMDDAGGWRFKLARELQAAGYEADANRIL